MLAHFLQMGEGGGWEFGAVVLEGGVDFGGEGGERDGGMRWPVAGEKVVVEDIDEDAGEAAEGWIEALDAAAEDGVGVGEGVDAAVALECIQREGELTADRERARELLFEAGQLFQDKFKNVQKAIETYESVLARAPT